MLCRKEQIHVGLARSARSPPPLPPPFPPRVYVTAMQWHGPSLGAFGTRQTVRQPHTSILNPYRCHTLPIHSPPIPPSSVALSYSTPGNPSGLPVNRGGGSPDVCNYGLQDDEPGYCSTSSTESGSSTTAPQRHSVREGCHSGRLYPKCRSYPNRKGKQNYLSLNVFFVRLIAHTVQWLVRSRLGTSTRRHRHPVSHC